MVASKRMNDTTRLTVFLVGFALTFLAFLVEFYLFFIALSLFYIFVSFLFGIVFVFVEKFPRKSKTLIQKFIEFSSYGYLGFVFYVGNVYMNSSFVMFASSMMIILNILIHIQRLIQKSAQDY